MDLVPAQDAKYDPFDSMTLVCHIDTHIRVVYEDWNGTEQERTLGRGTWPVKSTKLLGFRTLDPAAENDWSARQDLSELKAGVEISVGASGWQQMPRQLRRGR
ncbi:hypothetical protein RDJLphi1_gp59 [Roseobacter phage RDJL Phi 1]|uniref:Uncharacterized protein n=1 Tax=Roseobacter phage RDJL Phi 1 TaxID=562742 RepID=F4YXS0_9CAUD|nr:hypothetical protein RDJLphi1_gp59 [Roseobacter phage RDJL Phi 1]ADK73460.1 hypothetical protein RDJLphi1_gp59 [Roseobacter phage RDJL Phi 1]